MKYVILANSNDKTFDKPRQLMEINGEPLVKRTIRLLKENGIKDILITAYDKRFDGLGAKRYEPIMNDYDYATGKGYWLNAFPFEIMNEPICFIWGDVYFSEEAIKTIVETETNSTLFFCTYNNHSRFYIKEHDEPLAYKIVDNELFKEHVNKVKKLYDEGKTVRHPIVWEVYRSINNQDVNVHKMTKNYVAINDISCDIDSKNDIELLKKVLKGEINIVKCEATKDFTLERFDELKNIKRKNNFEYEKNKIYIGDVFECNEDLAKYLDGENAKGKIVIKILEVIPDINTTVTTKKPDAITYTSSETKKPKKNNKSKVK